MARWQRRQAEADRRFQQAEYERLERLFQRDSIARSQLDAQRAARDTAAARVAELDAALRVAALASRDGEVKAAAVEADQAASRLQSTLGLLLACVLIFVIANRVVGIAFSSIARNQTPAMQVSFFFFLPSIPLSGFMFPFAGMPQWGRGSAHACR